MALHEHMLRLLRSFLLSNSLLLGVLFASGQAQVTTTITPDRTLGTAVTQSGTFYNITGGTQPRNGSNLFHSFDRFNVGTNDTASFSGPTGIVNILSRVTGGQQSLIDGQLQSTIPGANLYLLNPSGVVFGPGASLDIKGSFHVSTADFLRFADGATFSAHVGQNSTLTVASPSAFGFLHSNPAGIAIVGSSLQVAEGKTISVVGGDIEIVGGVLTSPQVPSLGAPSGRINIASVASSGEVGLALAGQGRLLDIDTFERLGEINILRGARLDTSGNGGGTTVIRGGRLLIDNGSIAARNTGNADSLDLGIEVRMRGDVRLTGEAEITSRTRPFSQGRSGNISVVADNITIEGGALISSVNDAFSQGRGGDIAVMAPTGTISLTAGGRSDGGGIQTGSLFFSSGNVGGIRVEAGKLRLTNGALIGSLGLGSGKGGDVSVSARESVVISGVNSQNTPSGLASFAAGEPGSISLSAPVVSIDGGAVGTPGILPGQRAGDITVKADQQLTLVNGAQINSATVTDSKAGNISIEAGRLTLMGGAQIISSTGGPGAGGSVTVMATDTVSVSGTGPTGRFSGILATTEGTAIGAGAAGNVVVTAPRVIVTDGAVITSSTGGPGAGGSVQVMATDTVSLTGTAPTGRSSGILATTEGTAMGAGAAGNVVVTAPRIALTDGAQITSGTVGPGAGGNVQVTATDTLTLSGASPTGAFVSGIFANAQGTAIGAGTAGNVVVTAPRITLTDGAQINSGTFGPGAGGSVQVTATDTLTLSGASPTGAFVSGIFANAQGPEGGAGAAGSIVVTAPRITVTDGAAISSSTLGPGAGGSVTVMATDIVSLSGTAVTGRASGILATTEGTALGAGAAGSVVVTAPHITITAGAGISSSTGGPGAGGSVQVTATDTLTLSGTSPTGTFASGIFANAQGTESGAGAAGSIVVTAPRITVTDGAGINSSTLGPGAGGSVQVTATDTLTLSGTSPTGAFASGIFANAQGPEGGAGAAGSIVVTAPRVTVTDGAGINSSTLGPGAGGSVQVTATDTLALSGTTPTGAFASGIFANAQGPEGGAGAAGSIVVTAPRVTVTDGATISSSTLGPGAGGSVQVTATDTLTLSGTAATGRASGILATTEGTALGAGAAGSVVVTAPHITITAGAGISSSTGGPGAGGSVQVTATDTLTLSGTSPTGAFPSGIFANAQGTEVGAGAAGSIMVTAPRVTVTDGAGISSSTLGPGAGGSVTVMATDTLSLSGAAILSDAFGLGEQAGNAGRIALNAPVLIMDSQALVETRTFGNGNAGDVEIVAGRMSITGVAQIGSTSGLIAPERVITAGTGKGGTVTITATDTLVIAGRDLVQGLPSGVFTQTVGPGDAGRVVVSTPQLTMSDGAQIGVETSGDGRGGDVVVRTGRLSLTGGAQIRSGSGLTALGTLFIGAGAGGTVSVTATDTIDIAGQESGLSASTAGQGRGGDVLLQARQVRLTDGATISAESTGPGNAGNVTIVAGDTFQSTNSRVVARATQADGGNVQITAPNMVRLRDSAITAEVGGGPQTVGGNVTIDPQFVLLQNSQIVANAFEGQGGNIRIQAQRAFLADPASLVSASSALGINGIVNIQAPVNSISGAIAPLPQEFAPITELLRDCCVGRLREGRVSRFLIGGRDGIPSEPGSLLLSPLMQTDPREPREQAGTPARPGQVQEPVWYAQVGTLEWLDAECAKWTGQKGPTVEKKR